jgi:anti-sigma regulatory factor (Ser/Thr protein kinase)
MGAMLVRHEPTSVAAVRHEIASDLVQQGISEERVDDVTLVASELVSNAVRHAAVAPDLDLDIAWRISDSTVVVSVCDASDTEPTLRSASNDDAAGRGLTIVDRLAAAWGVERLRSGKRVWASVPIC